MYILPYLLLNLIFHFRTHHSWWSQRSTNEKQTKLT